MHDQGARRLFDLLCRRAQVADFPVEGFGNLNENLLTHTHTRTYVYVVICTYKRVYRDMYILYYQYAYARVYYQKYLNRTVTQTPTATRPTQWVHRVSCKLRCLHPQVFFDWMWAPTVTEIVGLFFRTKSRGHTPSEMTPTKGPLRYLHASQDWYDLVEWYVLGWWVMSPQLLLDINFAVHCIQKWSLGPKFRRSSPGFFFEARELRFLEKWPLGLWRNLGCSHG